VAGQPTKLLARLLHRVQDAKATNKLVASYGVLILMAAILGYEGISQVRAMGRVNQRLVDEHLTGVSNIKQAAIFEAHCTRILRDALLAVGDKDALHEQQQNFAEMEASARSSLNAAEKALSNEEGHAQLATVRAAIPKLHKLSTKLFESVAAEDRLGSLDALKEASTVATQINAEIAQISRQQEKDAAGATRIVQAEGHRAIVLLVTFFICALIISVIFSFWMMRVISQPLVEVVRVLKLAAAGDLSQRPAIQGKDEFGQMAQALNTALSAIENTIFEVSQTAKGLSGHTRRIATTAHSLAATASEQLSDLRLAASSVNQLAEATRLNAEGAREASDIAQNSSESAQKGEAVVNSAVESMSAILESSQRISGISSAMDEVAFQTRLLALNAAIEAARAGEHGLAFTVVAGEVRTLAEKSAASSKEITALVADSTEQISRGSELVVRSGRTLTEIMESVKKLADLMRGIASASQQQTDGIQTVNNTFAQIDSVMQSNMGRSQGLSTTARDLDSEAAHLQSLVSRFVLSPHATETTPSG